jgi:hypothetical protein
MANPEQLAILKRGVTQWNAWRQEHPDVTADLTKADLTKAELIRVNLSGANLNEANLLGAILVDANLREADLNKANLGRANLCMANLSGANFADALFSETVFGETNLMSARGLESCTHLGPSTLDHRTLARSGPLPLAFLRGVCLPDRLIDYLPSLLGDAIEFYACFISYSASDQAFADRLHADLQNNGVRCWFAPHDLPIGAETRTAIDEAIRLHDKVLLILSQHSVASAWVQKEVETAFEKERQTGKLVLFPIRLDDTVMTTPVAWAADIRRMRNIGDMRRWKRHDTYQRSFQRVLRDLHAKAATSAGERRLDE